MLVSGVRTHICFFRSNTSTVGMTIFLKFILSLINGGEKLITGLDSGYPSLSSFRFKSEVYRGVKCCGVGSNIMAVYLWEEVEGGANLYRRVVTSRFIVFLRFFIRNPFKVPAPTKPIECLRSLRPCVFVSR